MTYKKHFPIFANHPELTYLDSAATAQKPALVIDGVKKFMENSYANIHRGFYSLSEQSEDLYDQSKAVFAKLINAHASEIIYTYNATYAFNILVQALTIS
ncbi:aminotransferase class V-fold PLP-dependent enzyme [Patescibacteria group bacterium]|nr:aminotransferase class V-fold PLP-dependent enzyme [Patescibacteria group bacterium]